VIKAWPVRRGCGAQLYDGTIQHKLLGLLRYYGGDVVELGLALIVALRWYAARGRAEARSNRRTGVPRTARC